MGQERNHRDQTLQMSSQLDRIERKVNAISGDRPPPLPRKDNEPPSPTSSVSTARPVTPPLGDMRHLLGTIVAQNEDILQATMQHRSFDVDISPQALGTRRIEDLLRRALRHLGDTELADEPYYADQSEQSLNGRTQRDGTGSGFAGTASIFSDELNPKVRAPVNSFASSYDLRRHGDRAKVPSSHGMAGSEFDSEFAMADFPPDTPPEEYIAGPVEMPPHLRRTAARQSSEYAPSEVTVPATEETIQEDRPPVPYRPDEEYASEPSEAADEEYDRGPSRPLPPPQPVHLPTPVGSERGMPQREPGHGMHPPFMGSLHPMQPPGMMDGPRPSIPRIAGVRDPISTT